MEQKLSLPIEQICSGLPAEFSNYMHYCRSLRFEDKPDYPYLKQVFLDLLHKEGYDYDYVFDWTIVDRIDKNPALPVEKVHANRGGDQGSLEVNDGASADNIATGVTGPSKFKPKGQANSQPANHSNSDQQEEEDDGMEFDSENPKKKRHPNYA